MRILVISQYPIYPAIHGGQKRTAAIVSYYKEKHNVSHCAVYWPGIYQKKDPVDNSDHFVVTDNRLIRQLQLHPERSDILLSRSLSIRSKLGKRLRTSIATFRPHMIHVEQPYLVLSVKAILDEIGHTAIIVHGSQNVEYSLKKSIYCQSLPKKDLSYLIENTKRIENLAIAQADINIGISSTDVDTLRQYHRQFWLVAGNGTDTITEVPLAAKRDGEDSTVVFIGSAHPPNYMGIELLLKDTSYLVGKSHLLLIGGVAEYFRDKYKSDNPFWLGKTFVGKVDDRQLKNYIQQSDIVVLPIKSGGGSNLKTAEALGAHKRIVGTSFAFRGYEAYQELPNVFMANTAEEFKDVLLQVLMLDLKPYTDAQLGLVDRLKWRYVLRSLTIAIYCAYVILLAKRVRSLTTS